MSKSKPKTHKLDWEDEGSRKLQLLQDRCRHKYTIIKLLDFLHDETIDAAICKSCGYSPTY